MPKVLNKYKDDIPREAVYIGRPSPWGNPYVMGRDMDRQAVIEAYKEWLETQPALKENMRRQLRGKDLVCFCAPRACHGDIILGIANG